MSAAPPKPRLRWFQFGLRTLLLFMTLVVGLLVLWRTYVAPYRDQRQTMELVKKLNGRCQTTTAQPWLRRLFGSDFENIVLVDLADCDEPEKYLDAIARLPCLETLVVGGEKFTDDHLQRLHRISSLRGLVLDTTDVTDAGLADLQGPFPQLEVYVSQRRAIVAFEDHHIVGYDLCKTHKELCGLVGREYFREAYTVSIDMKIRPKAVPITYLKTLRSLRALDFSGMKVADADFEIVKDLPHLRWLSLEDTDVTNDRLRQVSALGQLEILELNDIQVTDAGLVHLKGLTNLRELRLQRTRVTDAGLAHLKGFSNLQTLFLDELQITDAGLKHLHVLSKLRFVSVRQTSVTPQGASEVQKVLPRCSVVLD